MRALAIDKVKPGMKIGRTIFSSNGKVLLAAGIQLNEQYISRLRELAMSAVYIADDRVGEIELNDVVSEQTRIEALNVTRVVMNNLQAGKETDYRVVSKVINRMMDEIINNRHQVISLMDLGSMNDNAFKHAVNVTVLSLLVGTILGYDQLNLKNLAIGAFLHDVGKSEKSPVSTGEDLQHPTVGFELIRKLEGTSLFSAHVALQHHESFNGKGYPRGLSGEDIHEFARIVAITNTYDNLTTDHPRKPRLSARQALEYINSRTGELFDPRIVKVFAGCIALIPVGNFVALNSGEKGVVVKVEKNKPTRPVVRILVDPQEKRLNPPYDLDLAQNRQYFITRYLEENDIDLDSSSQHNTPLKKSGQIPDGHSQGELELQLAEKMRQSFSSAIQPTMNFAAVEGRTIVLNPLDFAYQDWFSLEGGNVGLCMGQVTSGGVQAALTIEKLRRIFRSLTGSGSALHQVLSNVNEQLYTDLQAQHNYLSFLYAVYNPENQQLQYINAGHKFPVVYRPGNHEFFQLKSKGMLLGEQSQANYESNSIQLQSGDIVLFYSPGVEEFHNEQGAQFSLLHIIDTLRKYSSYDALGLLDCLSYAFIEYIGESEHSRNISFFVLKVN